MADGADGQGNRERPRTRSVRTVPGRARQGAKGDDMDKPLDGQVALVTGGTRGAGRGMAVELGAAGATVYVTGRTTRETGSPVGRKETIEDTAQLVTEAGGHGIAVRCDHMRPDDVAALARQIEQEQDGRLDVLVDDTWGGDRW